MRAWPLFVLLMMPALAAADPALNITTQLPAAHGIVIVDARARTACTRGSVQGARCLPAADFLGPGGRLVSLSQAFWLLGTAGLNGAEHVAVVGENSTERDFVAGMLYLCGQRRVSIISVPLSRLVSSRAPGAVRANTRQAIYQVIAREHRIVLRDELARARAGKHPPLVLNGPDARPPDAAIRSGSALPVVAAQNPYASVAAFAALRAKGADVRVLIDGQSTPIAQTVATSVLLTRTLPFAAFVLFASVGAHLVWRSR